MTEEAALRILNTINVLYKRKYFNPIFFKKRCGVKAYLQATPLCFCVHSHKKQSKALIVLGSTGKPYISIHAFFTSGFTVEVQRVLRELCFAMADRNFSSYSAT